MLLLNKIRQQWSQPKASAAARRELLAEVKAAPRRELELVLWNRHFYFNVWHQTSTFFQRDLAKAIDRRFHTTRLPHAPAIRTPRVPRTAILLVDADYRFQVRDDVAAETAAMAQVLKKANARGLPVFQINLPKGKTDPRLKRHYAPHNWTRMRKVGNSAFEGTTLTSRLEAKGITDVIVMGAYQEACIMETAADALARGFHVHTTPEVIQAWTRDKLPHWYRRYLHLAPRAADLPMHSGLRR